MPFINSVRGSFGAQGKLKNRIGRIGPLTTGGTISTAGGYRIHTFQTGSISGGTFTFTPDEFGIVEYLIVAGGAGSGGTGQSPASGGGGAGGMRYGTSSINPQSYSIIVGNGGERGYGNANIGGYQGTQTNGGNSSAFGIVSTGGGVGGTYHSQAAQNGGSGGGEGYPIDGGVASGAGQGISGQGNNGGTAGQLASQNSAGGGGAGSVGGNANSGVGTTGGNGGNGVSNSISGSSVTYAGGGAGANGYQGSDSTRPSGGIGGGGSGGVRNGNQVGDNGTNGLGGGAGGSGSESCCSQQYGAYGGSGIIIVRYPI